MCRTSFVPTGRRWEEGGRDSGALSPCKMYKVTKPLNWFSLFVVCNLWFSIQRCSIGNDFNLMKLFYLRRRRSLHWNRPKREARINRRRFQEIDCRVSDIPCMRPCDSESFWVWTSCKQVSTLLSTLEPCDRQSSNWFKRMQCKESHRRITIIYSKRFVVCRSGVCPHRHTIYSLRTVMSTWIFIALVRVNVSDMCE